MNVLRRIFRWFWPKPVSGPFCTCHEIYDDGGPYGIPHNYLERNRFCPIHGNGATS